MVAACGVVGRADEAERAARNHFLDGYDLDLEELDIDESQNTDNPAEDASLGSVTSADEWPSVTAKVVELWQPGHESIGQVGLIGDETATCKLTIWDSADAPGAAEGEGTDSRTLSPMSTKVMSACRSTPRPALRTPMLDFNVESADNRITGALVISSQAAASSSGVPMRAVPECSRTAGARNTVAWMVRSTPNQGRHRRRGQCLQRHLLHLIYPRSVCSKRL